MERTEALVAGEGEATVASIPDAGVQRRIVELAVLSTHATAGALIVSPEAPFDSVVLERRPDGMLHELAVLPEMAAATTLTAAVMLDDGDVATLMVWADTFDDDARTVLQAFAANAGSALRNARALQDFEYQSRWNAALAPPARMIMDDSQDDAIDVLIHEAREIAAADIVAVYVLPEGSEEMQVIAAIGAGADELVQRTIPVDRSLSARAIRENIPVLSHVVSERSRFVISDQDRLGPGMAVPFTPPNGARGALAFARVTGAPEFREREIHMANGFAYMIATALAVEDARVERHRVAVAEDRERIARDLHDHVIQRLFAVGLELHSIAQADGIAEQRLVRQVDEIDAAIAQIRQSIYAMSHDDPTRSPLLRARVLEVADRVARTWARRPHVRFLGPVDLVVDRELAHDVSAVVTEGLSNAGRHARAEAVRVVVTYESQRLRVEVVDDGVGRGDREPTSGLVNLRARALARGGTFELSTPDGGGTRLVWDVPAS